MPVSEIARILLLSALWGGSFLFLRVAAPEFGPVSTIGLRVALAAACLAPILLRRENRVSLLRYSGGMMVMAVLGAAVPFCLLAFATLSLEAGMTAVINAMTPVFTMLVTLAWTRQPPSARQIGGLALGLIGVVILSWDHLSLRPGGGGWAVMAGLLATICYAYATNFLKIRMPHATAQSVTFGSMAGAAILLAPLIGWTWPESPPSGRAWLCLLLLAVISTAFAYLIFFRLMKNVSALAATSVTFLVPVFAFLWGAIFLGEAFSLRALVGMVVTMVGTALTLGLGWPKPSSRSQPA